MKIKTNELSGDALDYFVGRMHKRFDDPKCTVPYSTEWEDGGPLIHVYSIELRRVDTTGDAQWSAFRLGANGVRPSVHAFGSTPLIAAMRCYVASVWGEEVEVPEELNIHNQEGVEP